jgi:hypothetical protein
MGARARDVRDSDGIEGNYRHVPRKSLRIYAARLSLMRVVTSYSSQAGGEGVEIMGRSKTQPIHHPSKEFATGPVLDES